jgi:virginiamycin B lyase
LWPIDAIEAATGRLARLNQQIPFFPVMILMKSFPAFLLLLLVLSTKGYTQKKNFLIEDVSVATLRLEGYPDWIEMTDGSVWISNGNFMQRFNPETNDMVAEVELEKPCAAFAIGFGSVWVASCGKQAIVRISLEDNKITAIIPVGIANDEGSVVAAENGVWVLSDVKGVLTRIDPKTNQVVARIAVKPNSFAAMAGFGSIWITNTGDADAGSKTAGSIQRIDPKTNKVVATINVGKGPRFLAVGEGGVWTVNQVDGSVSRIDPKTNTLVSSLFCDVAGTGGDIAVGGGFVWVRAKNKLLLAIDPATNGVIATFGPPSGSGAVRASANAVWVSSHDINTVWKLNPAVVKK